MVLLIILIPAGLVKALAIGVILWLHPNAYAHIASSLLASRAGR